MKKTYITPAVDIIKSNCNQSILNASIVTGQDGKTVPTDTDNKFVVGTKGSNSDWEDFDDEEGNNW